MGLIGAGRDESPAQAASLDSLPSLSGARHRLIDAGEVRLHVAELGPEDGPPVVLVHGWPQHWWCWRRVAPLLPDRRCVMIDLRGHGWSEAPPHGYEKQRLADDVVAAIDALGLDRVCFVGHDWGAIVGFLIATQAPDRIGSLLALSAPHPWPSLHDRLSPRRLAAGLYQLPLSAPLVGRSLMRMGLTARMLARSAPEGTFSDEDLRIYDDRLSAGAGPRVTVAMYRTFLARELPSAALRPPGKMDLPARLVVGARDLIVRRADLHGHEAHAPRMSVHWIRGAGHFLPEERPAEVVRRIEELCPAGREGG